MSGGWRHGFEWNDTSIDRLKAMLGEGLSATEIASALSREFGAAVSRNSVIGKVARSNLLFFRKGPRPVDVTPEIAAEIKRLAESGMPRRRITGELKISFAKIAKVLGPGDFKPVTKVISKARGRVKTREAARPKPVDSPPIAPTAPEPMPEPVDAAAPMGDRCTILELKEYSCRWPIGEPGTEEFRYCGARSGTGIPYCGYHARIAYQPVADRRRKVAGGR
jgi:GcrA cell cycle regulator